MHSTDLLIFQPTAFCNIDCRYCYLPDRSNKSIMSLDTVRATLRNVNSSNLLQGDVTVLWHAGEPLVAGLDFYHNAFLETEKYDTQAARLCNHIQTNGLLLNSDFCELFARHNVRVGISIDGPEWLHNKNRKTRSGKGSFGGAMRGLDLLRRHNVDFNVITVVTSDTLDHAEELYDFYLANGISSVGLNVEEMEGPNTHSKLFDERKKFSSFLRKLVDLSQLRREVHIREFEMMKSMIFSGDYLNGNCENNPYSMINVAVNGDFCTYSPEFIGIPSDRYSNFIFGNVHKDQLSNLGDVLAFRRLKTDVDAGIASCKKSCAYFPVCGGGAPSNKFFENGRIDSTTTKYCEFNRQIVADVVIAYYEDLFEPRQLSGRTDCRR